MITSLLYGLYAGAVSIAISLLLYFTGLWKSDWNTFASWIALPFLALFIWMAMRERKREDYGGVMTYGQGVGTGVLVGLFAGILYGVYIWVYLNNINPEFVTWMVSQRQEAMQGMNGMKPADVERARDMMQKFFVLFAVGGILIWDVFAATIVSLITAIFVRTKEEPAAIPPPAV